jgi:hypothetical protein
MHGLDQAIGAKASQTENQNNWLTYVKLGKIGNEPVVRETRMDSCKTRPRLFSRHFLSGSMTIVIVEYSVLA